MQVFIAYSPDKDARVFNKTIELLKQTLELWDECEDAEVNAIQCKGNKFELTRRITAENLAHGDYVLADLGCVLSDKADFGRLKLEENQGMAGLGENSIPTGVRVIRKGVVKKWEPKMTDSYDIEHARAIKNAGKEVVTFHDITYRHLLGRS